MFPTPAEVLKVNEGSLAETPLPLLLHSLLMEERSCTLELKLRGLEKRILIEDGSPVDCRTNLLHETIGKYLVEKGKLQEQQYQECLVESINTGTKIGEVLVKKGLIPPFDLFKQMQANLAHKILDCFRWSEAKYRLLGDTEAAESPVKMNTVQLILTGSSNFLPFEIVASQLAFADDQRFTSVPNAPHDLKAMKLSPKEMRLLQIMRAKPTFAEVMARTGFDMEEAIRRLYAFCVLGMVGFVNEPKGAPAPAAPAPSASAPAVVAKPPEPEMPVLDVTQVLAEPEAPPEPEGVPFLDDDEATKNALVAAFLEHRTKDPFDLLGVTEDAQVPALRKAFLTAAARFPPVRFKTADLRDKAEALLAAYARSYGALVEPELMALHRKRRQIAAEQKRSAPRPSTVEQFKIQTDLLDGKSQFASGKQRLEASNPRGALEYFQYAFDIEPKAIYRAYLAWTRYLINPKAYARLALQELNDAIKSDANCEEAPYFAGEIQRAEGQFDAAEASFRLAFKANPKNRKYIELAQDMGRQKKR